MCEKDLAEKRFDLLVQYKIIKPWECYMNKNKKIYFATQKSGPHRIPDKPHESTRIHYILNNKS